MKILLAGGAGYVGTELADLLVKHKHSVDIYDTCLLGNNVSGGINVIKKNVFEISDNDVKKYDAAIFLAGLSNDPMANFSPTKNFIENTAVPIYLAYLCKQNNIEKFVFASSCSVYGFTNNEPISENDNPKPQYPYGISKLAAEAAIMNLTDYHFRPICLRKGTIGGYSKRMRFDLVVNTMVKSSLLTKKIHVNNPNIWRPLIDIRDVCDAYVKAVECDTSVSGVYNILEDNYTIGDLARIIQNTLREYGYDVDIETSASDDIRNYKATKSKAKAELKFEASYLPKDTVTSILDNVGQFTNLNDPKYYNIQVMKKVSENE